MKILILGSLGFIGRHTFNHFSSDDRYDCWGCDIAENGGNKKHFVVDKLNTDYCAIFRQVAFDICINCSGAASVPESMINPLNDFQLNTLNVVKVLDAIKQYAPHCKFLNLSSAAVYGNAKQLPISEAYPCKPVSPYGFHKLQSEQICQEYHGFFGIPTISARIFSAFGPGLRKQMFWDWAQKIHASSAITLFGTGNESRDFIFIDDLVQAISCIASNGDFSGGVINIANGKEVYIKEAIGVFHEAWGGGFSYKFNGTIRPGDPLNWSADIDQLSSLGYKQRISIEQGIKYLVKWLKDEK